MMTISIVTYKTDLKELSKCFKSLTSSLISQIYIIDNSKEESIKEFCHKQTNTTYIASDNVGYGAGHNKALKKIIGTNVKYHLILNSDVYFEPDLLERLAKYMDEHEDVAQIQPNVIYPNGETQYTCRLLPTPINLIFRRFLPKKIGERMDRRYTLKFWDHQSEANIPYHQGSFMFFRVKCFDKIGLFDERFFMYPEDIDITRRMHKYYKTIYYPKETIVHAHRAASYKSKKMLKIHIENMIRYFNKWGWFFDKERKQWNKQLLKELGYKN